MDRNGGNFYNLFLPLHVAVSQLPMPIGLIRTSNLLDFLILHNNYDGIQLEMLDFDFDWRKIELSRLCALKM